MKKSIQGVPIGAVEGPTVYVLYLYLLVIKEAQSRGGSEDTELSSVYRIGLGYCWPHSKRVGVRKGIVKLHTEGIKTFDMK